MSTEWTPSLSTLTVIHSMTSLLSESKIPENVDGFANPKAALQMMKNYPHFFEQARKYCE